MLTTSLNDKVILITGASSGIGRASALRLAGLGTKLILTARRLNRLEELAQEINAHYPNCKLLLQKLDVQDHSAVKNFIIKLPESWQSIDILLNNAGLALSSDPLQTGDTDNWNTMIDTNIKGLLYVSRYVIPGMIARAHGHIVNIGSVAGQDCYPNGNVYSATKHAVRAITKSMRLDLAGKNIRVSEIAPGAVETEFSKVRWKDEEKANAFYQDFNPLLAEDIADAILYCISCPPHVNIAEMTIFPTDQATCSVINRKK